MKTVDDKAYYRAFKSQHANYDEGKVPDYTLPELLVSQEGERITTSKAWETVRRPEILKLFQEQVYGKSPGKPEGMTFTLTKQDDKALKGKAIQKEVRISFLGCNDGPFMDLLIFLPPEAKRPTPLFLMPNFGGNQCIHDDKGISLSEGPVRKTLSGNGTDKATEASRGKRKGKWPIEHILSKGYGVATFNYYDLDPDVNDFKDGIHPHYYKAGQKRPAADEWGAIGAWAWGNSRALDYFETDADIDHKKVIVLGHSRLGKTALWTGAQDERFAIVISNNSGCGGAALSRRAVGETVGRINHSFPHWFCDNFKKYNRNENALPVDQHMLIALIAPRPVYVASAQEDRWADPRGEFLSVKHAQAAYSLYGYEENLQQMPAVETPVMGRMGYHIRAGKHDVLVYDWDRYIEFADRNLVSHGRK